MLEEILKSINSNLERIAKVIEKQPICTIGVDTGKDLNMEAPKELIAQQTPALINNSNSGVVQTPQSVTGEVTPQPIMAQAIPTAQVQESFTFEQLALAMSNAVSAGKMNVVQGILQQFGVQALTQINPADYNKLATMLKEAGVAV